MSVKTYRVFKRMEPVNENNPDATTAEGWPIWYEVGTIAAEYPSPSDIGDLYGAGTFFWFEDSRIASLHFAEIIAETRYIRAPDLMEAGHSERA